MAYEQKDNTAALFRNDKGDNDKRPDYRGDGMVNGQLVRLSAWVSTPQNGGAKYLKIKFEEPRQEQRAAPKADEPKPVPVAAGGWGGKRRRFAFLIWTPTRPMLHFFGHSLAGLTFNFQRIRLPRVTLHAERVNPSGFECFRASGFVRRAPAHADEHCNARPRHRLAYVAVMEAGNVLLQRLHRIVDALRYSPAVEPSERIGSNGGEF